MIAMARNTTDKWYRSPRGKVFGLCTGLAEWRDLDAKMVRLIVCLAIVLTGIFPGAVIYLVLSLFIPMNPEDGSQTGNRSSDEKMRNHYDDMKAKVDSMEQDMFDKEKNWDDRFNEGR